METASGQATAYDASVVSVDGTTEEDQRERELFAHREKVRKLTEQLDGAKEALKAAERGAKE